MEMEEESPSPFDWWTIFEGITYKDKWDPEFELASDMTPKKEFTVFQLIVQTMHEDSDEIWAPIICRRMHQRFGGEWHCLHDWSPTVSSQPGSYFEFDALVLIN